MHWIGTEVKAYLEFSIVDFSMHSPLLPRRKQNKNQKTEQRQILPFDSVAFQLHARRISDQRQGGHWPCQPLTKESESGSAHTERLPAPQQVYNPRHVDHYDIAICVSSGEYHPQVLTAIETDNRLTRVHTA